MGDDSTCFSTDSLSGKFTELRAIYKIKLENLKCFGGDATSELLLTWLKMRRGNMLQ